jgi:cold shock protein
VPVGKVKWYDAEKGFGFLSTDEGGDVFVRASALPAGTESLKSGTRVEFGIVQGRKGDQALQVRLLEAPPSVSKARRKSPEDMITIVEDLIKLLDGVGNSLRRGRYPAPREAKQTAAVLRAVATDIEG